MTGKSNCRCPPRRVVGGTCVVGALLVAVAWIGSRPPTSPQFPDVFGAEAALKRHLNLTFADADASLVDMWAWARDPEALFSEAEICRPVQDWIDSRVDLIHAAPTRPSPLAVEATAGLGNVLRGIPGVLILSLVVGRPLVFDDLDPFGVFMDRSCFIEPVKNKYTPALKLNIAQISRPKFFQALFHTDALVLDWGSPSKALHCPEPRGSSPTSEFASTRFCQPVHRESLRHIFIGNEHAPSVQADARCNCFVDAELPSLRADFNGTLSPSEAAIVRMPYRDNLVTLLLDNPAAAELKAAALPTKVLRGCLLRATFQWPTALFAGVLAPYLPRLRNEHWIGIHLRAGDVFLQNQTATAEDLAKMESVGRQYHNTDNRLPLLSETWNMLQPCLELAAEGLDPARIRYFLASDSTIHAAYIQAKLGAHLVISTEGTAVHSVYGHSDTSSREGASGEYVFNKNDLKTFLDWTLLALSHRMVVSGSSTFSDTAASFGQHFKPADARGANQNTVFEMRPKKCLVRLSTY